MVRFELRLATCKLAVLLLPSESTTVPAWLVVPTVRAPEVTSKVPVTVVFSFKLIAVALVPPTLSVPALAVSRRAV